MSNGELTFFCGKMGSGKTTQSKAIAQKKNAVLLSEDEWLHSLYPGAITSLEDYVQYSNRLKPLVKTLVQSILVSGVDVVMDFPANTPSQRKWFTEIFRELDAPHELVFMDIPERVCLDQIAKRRQLQPHRAETDTEEMFEEVTKYFVAPASEERFDMTVVTLGNRHSFD